ncbi:hypothetical protein [Morganella phage Mecenats66]|nr:hypothetical protein [Morganella phage Mecenats66]
MSFPGMQFNPDWFNSHLDNIGQEFLWRKALMCPCQQANSLSADPECKNCHGIGYTWDSPVLITSGAAGEKMQSKWIDMGYYEQGDLVMTVPENNILWDQGGRYDRLTAINSTHRLQRVLIRGSRVGESLMKDVKSVSAVRWLNSDGVLVNGDLPAVTEDGGIDFTGVEVQPVPGSRYTIEFDAYSEYFLYQDDFRVRNEHAGMRLPKMIVIRRYDLLNRAVMTP